MIPTVEQLRDTEQLSLRGIRLFSAEDEKHPHAPAGSPQGGQFAKKKGSGTAPTKAATPVRPAHKTQHQAAPHNKATATHKPAAHKATPPTPAAGTKHPMLAAGRNNDPARVKELQHLLGVLKLGKVDVNGRYGTATEDAVKAAQVKLGMSPTGHASASFVRKLQAAQALSPCLGKG